MGSFQVFTHALQMFAWLTKPPFVCKENLQELSLATDGCAFLMFLDLPGLISAAILKHLFLKVAGQIYLPTSQTFLISPHFQEGKLYKKSVLGQVGVAAVRLSSLEYTYMMVVVICMAPPTYVMLTV